MDDRTSILDAAIAYTRRGWFVVPIPFRQKGPKLSGWQSLRLTENDLPQHFNGQPMNIGVLLGEPSGIVDVDLDCPESRKLAGGLLPPTGAIFGHKSKPASHRLYTGSINGQTTRQFTGPSGDCLVELRCTGGQTVFPGSVHPDGEDIEWDLDEEPPTVDIPKLLEAAGELAAACLLLRHYPVQGSRHNFIRALAGGLLRAGWPVSRVERYIEVIAEAAGDDEVEDRVRVVADTKAAIDASENVTGWPSVSEIIDGAGPKEQYTARIRRHLGMDKRQIPGSFASACIASSSDAKPAADDVVERAEPIPLAENFIDTHYRDRSDRLLLRRHRADFYSFADSCYQQLTDEEIDAAIYRHLEQCSTVQRDGTGEPKLDELGNPKLRPITPRSAIVREVRLAIPSRGVLLDDRIDAPCWLNGRDDLDTTKIVSCQNGLLDLSTRTLHPLTPELFSTHSLPFDYDPDAPDPVAWLAFLDQLWETDLEAWRALQMWFGYCLCDDTRQHKILMIVGPKRSGKGTMARVLTGLLGAVNVAGPPLGSLATNFGLQPLMGKPLAIVSDARLSGRTDQAIVVERLLSISGEDSLTIDRKHKSPVTVKLPTRFMLLTNELPRLRDTSGALASRFIILTLTESWYGREDHGLTDTLLAELPGVLNWALDGWTKLQEQGRFTQPKSSADAMRELEDLSSPMGAFLRDRCNVALTCSIECGELFEAWKSWCEEQGRDRPGTKQTFSRDLHAAVPGLRTSRPRTDAGRARCFEGVELGHPP